MNRFLLNNVDEGKINYQFLKDNPDELNGLIRGIEDFYLNNQEPDFTTAFYINSYNLLVIKQVRDNYPISSPMDIDGFFNQKQFMVAGEWLTLDNIEFDKLLGPTKDPRIHFALGCAARSCPSLYDMAYTPQHLQEQLEFRAQLIIDRPNYVDVDQQNRVVLLNKIFDWYQNQFTLESPTVIDYINKYRFYNVPTDFHIQFQEYDWSLNSR